MKKTTLENSFHNTKITILADAEMLADGNCPYRVLCERAMNGDKDARRTARRIENTLCGSDDCTCGVVR